MEGERALKVPDDSRDPHLEPPLHVSQQCPNDVHEPCRVHAVAIVASTFTGAREVRGDPGLHLQQLLPRGHHVALQLERFLQEPP